jgi:hypothetical protein
MPGYGSDFEKFVGSVSLTGIKNSTLCKPK